MGVLLGVVIGVLATIVVLRRLRASVNVPVREVNGAIRRIRAGEYDVANSLPTDGPLAELGHAVELMVTYALDILNHLKRKLICGSRNVDAARGPTEG